VWDCSFRFFVVQFVGFPVPPQDFPRYGHEHHTSPTIILTSLPHPRHVHMTAFLLAFSVSVPTVIYDWYDTTFLLLRIAAIACSLPDAFYPPLALLCDGFALFHMCTFPPYTTTTPPPFYLLLPPLLVPQSSGPTKSDFTLPAPDRPVFVPRLSFSIQNQCNVPCVKSFTHPQPLPFPAVVLAAPRSPPSTRRRHPKEPPRRPFVVVRTTFASLFVVVSSAAICILDVEPRTSPGFE